MDLLRGTGRLIRLALRRDRIKLSIWILAVISLVAFTLPALTETYGSEEMRQMYFSTISTSAIGKLFAGNVDTATFGAIVTAETLLYVGLAVAFMNVLLVIRHTRFNEELGSAELIHSARVGRFAALSAALVLAAAANLIVAIGLAFALGVNQEITWSQAWLYGIGVAFLGMSFTAVAAVTAQLASSARGASSMGAIAIGAAFLLRGVGDVLAKTGVDGLAQPLWISYLSPIGWLQLLRPLTGQRWEMLLIPAAFCGVALALAYRMLASRDIGSGILSARAGAARAKASLLAAAPFGLVVRLQKGVFIGWLIGAVVLAGVTGGMAHEVLDMIEESEMMREYVMALGGEGNYIEIFMSAMLALIAMTLAAYVVQAMQKVRSEESRGFIESLLATALDRRTWLVVHVAVVGVCSAIILAVSGATVAVSAGLAGKVPFHDWHIMSYVLAGLYYLPVLLLFAGVVAFVFGLVPRFTIAAGWLSFAFVLLIGQLGALLKLPQFVMDLNPFTHLPAVPASEIAVRPLLIIMLVAAVLIVSGLATFRRRDITTA